MGSRSNISNNTKFLQLFDGIKNRYKAGLSFDKDISLKNDTLEAIDTMITAIELGTGDDGFIGIFLPKMNRLYESRLPAPAGIGMENGVPTLYMNPMLLFILIDGYRDFKDIIQHEVYHLVFKHLIHDRNYPDHTKCNIAKDVSVNQYINLSDNLKKTLYTLENFNKKYKLNAEPKREFEYYYNLMPDKEEKSNNEKSLKNQLNELEDKKDNGENSEEIQKKIQEIVEYIEKNYIGGDISENQIKNMSDQITLEEMVKHCISEAKEKGKIPGNINTLLDNIYFRNPIIPWQNELRHIIGTIPCPYRKTMRVKNRRQPERSDILGRVNDHKLTLIAAIDTSASVDNECFKFFLNEIFNIIKDVKCEVYILQCDSQVTSFELIKNKKDIPKVNFTGRGGTEFTPVFEYIKKKIPRNNKPDILVYFTDGYGETQIPSEFRGNYDILWVLTGLKDTLSVKSPEYIRRVRYLNIEGKKYL